MAGHPTDVLVEDLVDVYARQIGRLEGIVADGLRRGIDPERLGDPDAPRGTSTAAYRQRQLEQANAIADELFRTAGQAGPVVVDRAYRSGLVTVDRALTGTPQTGARGAFGRVHVRAVEAAAANLTRSLEAGARAIGENVALVFERADLLEGALPNVAGSSATVGGMRFLGRRVDDPYRRLALEAVAGGIVSLDTRRQVSQQLARRLIAEGVTDATTGFVDRAGRRWPLTAYAAMVARTTTREAMTAGTVNRLLEHGLDLVTISSHSHAADECSPYDGQTFSLSGDDDRYPRLDRRPPFHPNCGHVLGPASANLDDYERELERAAAEQRAPARVREPDVTPQGEGTPPFSPEARPHFNRDTADRLEAQRILEADPGPDPDALAARLAEYEAADRPLAEARELEVKADRRRRKAALRQTMSPELAREVLGARGTRPKAWAVEEGIEERMLAGELTVDDVEQLAYEHYEALEAKRIMREAEREANFGSNTRALPCDICGKLKRMPADVCPHCGNDPLSLGETAAEYNAAFGYFGAKAATRQGLHYGASGFGNKEERTSHWAG